jgi:hypothetical protein
MVEHIMTEGGVLGTPGTRYALESMPPENPAMSVRVYKEEDGGWEPTAYSIGMMYADAEKIDMKEHEMDAEETMDMNNEMDMDKAKKPNYEDMIKPRRGGSTPANPRLYARIQREAKDKFDVYPSAVANGWVVQEYKRRGGTYKADGIEAEKREFSSGTRERMAEAGTAMPDGSFPIANANDLRNAIQSVGRAKNYEAAKRHIIRRARALGMTDMLPEDWRNSTMKGGDWSGSVFDLNPFVK